MTVPQGFRCEITNQEQKKQKAGKDGLKNDILETNMLALNKRVCSLPYFQTSVPRN